MMKYTNCTSSVIVASVENANNGLNVLANSLALDSTSSMTAGSIAYFVDGQTTSDQLNNALTATENGKFIWKDKQGKMHYSDTINISGITIGETASNVAAAAQVTYIGYNGTSGSINLVDNCPYELTLYMKNSSITAGHIYNAYPKHVGGFVSSMDATQEEIALATVYSGWKQFKDEKVMKVQFDAICSGTGIATSAGTLGVSRGSNVISWAENSTDDDAGKYDSDGSSVAVGDYIRIGANTVVTAVYKVTAIAGTAADGIYLTLDRPFTGTTNTAVAANAAFIIPSATGLAANWGVRMVGIELFATTYGIETTNYWSIDGRMEYDVNTFTIAYYSGFTTDTAITYATTATRGTGTYWEVVEDEYFSKGFDGQFIYTGYPAYLFVPNATPGYTYAAHYIYWYDDGTTSPTLGDTTKQPRALKFWIPTTDATSLARLTAAF